MAHRTVLTARQRKALLDFPEDEASMLNHYVLSEDDLHHINRKRGDHNRLGFALQLCAFRYPGRFIQSDEPLPEKLVAFVSAQLGINPTDVEIYAQRKQTHYEHSVELQRTHHFLSFHDCETKFIVWLTQAAINARNNAELAELFVAQCRQQKIILPGVTVIDRLCAEARIAAERDVVRRIAECLDDSMKTRLNAMLTETVDGRLTLHGWLKRFEVGHNSANVNRLLDKLEYLKELNIPESVLEGIPSHRVIWLRQQGEAYYADGLRDINETRRLAILAVCVIEWKAMITDAILETHDRIVGKLYNTCKRMRDDQLVNQKKVAHETLTFFAKLSKKLLKAHENNALVADVIESPETLEKLMTAAMALTKKLENDPLEYVLLGYGKFRRYTHRMLETITFKGNAAAHPLLEAIELLKHLNRLDGYHQCELPIYFANAKWSKRLGNAPDRKLWETALLFTVRDGLRSRDIWAVDSRIYQDTRQQFLPTQQAKQILSLPIPLNANEWITGRKELLEQGIKHVAQMIQQDTLPNSCIENGKIYVNRLDSPMPEGMDTLTLDIYKEMPQISITDILMEVAEDTGFTDCFIHIHTGSTCADTLGLLNVLLAGGINMGLKKMALCSSSHTSFWSLMRISSWHVTSGAMEDALAIIIDKHKELSLSAAIGDGSTASSDGQFYPSGGSGEAMNLINAKYGNIPGMKAYTHISDQYGPFAVKTIPATAHEAPYILDGLTMNDAGKRIKEHYADTGGFTDHVFAMCALLGYQFAPRLRNLSSLNLYGMHGITLPKVMQELIKAKVNIARIESQWPDIIRLIASIITHRVVPSEILRQLASFPRQNELAIALREIGRIERTIFILSRISSVDMQRRAQIGLNKEESHQALKRALNFNRRGEISDRTSENQHLRMMHLNLLAAIIIYWNTKHLGRIIDEREEQGIIIPPEQLAHLSPLGWEHIILTGYYRWGS
jgi:TnpA family transposase